MRAFSSLAAVVCLLSCGSEFSAAPSSGAGAGGNSTVGNAGLGGATAGTGPTAGAGGSRAGAGGTGGAPGGTGGASGGATGGGSNAGTTGLGGRCEGDDDCAGDMHCITADGNELLGGGAAHGYCTKACDDDLDSCAALDPSGVCGPFDVAPIPRWCMLGCEPGASAVGFSDDVCLGRMDVACAPLGSGAGELITACRPFCGSDADCNEGRYCNIATGACVDTRPTGKPVGERCNAQQSPDPCAGFCLGNFCTGYCVVGTEGMAGACGSAVNGLQLGACLYTLDTESGFSSSGFGDMGLCAPLCDCTAECVFENEICAPLGGNLPVSTGRGGFCTPGEHPGELTSCG